MSEIADATVVKLQSNDDRVFEVTYKIAKQSGTLKNMLDGVCIASPFPVSPTLSPFILFVILLCRSCFFRSERHFVFYSNSVADCLPIIFAHGHPASFADCNLSPVADLGADDDTVIPLPVVNGPTLEKVVKYCGHHQDDPVVTADDDTRDKVRNTWGSEFFFVATFLLKRSLVGAFFCLAAGSHSLPQVGVGLLDSFCNAVVRASRGLSLVKGSLCQPPALLHASSGL